MTLSELHERHTKFLCAVEEELNKNAVSYEHFLELLLMLAANEENLIKSKSVRGN